MVNTVVYCKRKQNYSDSGKLRRYLAAGKKGSKCITDNSILKTQIDTNRNFLYVG